MTTLPGYVPGGGYGYHGRALYNEKEYKVFGADCGADCACDAVAIPVESPMIPILEKLMEAGLVPSRES